MKTRIKIAYLAIVAIIALTIICFEGDNRQRSKEKFSSAESTAKKQRVLTETGLDRKNGNSPVSQRNQDGLPKVPKILTHEQNLYFLGQTDPTAGIELWMNLNNSVPRQKKLDDLRNFIAGWTMKSQFQSLEWAQSLKDPAFRQEAVETVFVTWLQKKDADPLEILGKINDFRGQLWTENICVGALGAVAKKDPTLALERLKSLSDTPSVYFRAQSEIFSRVGEQDPQLLFELLRDSELPVDAEEYFSNLSINIASRNLASGLELVDSNPFPDGKNKLLGQLVNQLVDRDPETIIDFAKAHLNNGNIAPITENLGRWILNNPGHFEDWLSTQDVDFSSRILASKEVISSLVASGPEKAVDFILSKGKKEDLPESMKVIAKTWAFQSPQEASRWIEQLPINQQMEMIGYYAAGVALASPGDASTFINASKLSADMKIKAINSLNQPQ